MKSEPLGIGVRLKEIRNQLGYSQRELARRADMTHGCLSHIEQGRVSPSISSLEKILSPLGLSLTDFFSDRPILSPIVIRQNELIHGQHSKVSYNSLPIRLTPHVGTLSRHTYEPGAHIFSEWATVCNRVAGIVIVGQLQMTLGGFEYALNEGDGFEFLTTLDHAIENVSSARCVVAVAECEDAPL